VLAAGRGVRMGGRTPKSLIPVGYHEPLLHYILAGLRTAGVDDLLVVTGWRHTEVQDFVGQRWEAKTTFVRNARYASWGNFHSLRLAIDQSPGATILAINSDIVVHPQVLTNVATTTGDLVLAVQQRPQLSAEDMRVQLDEDRAVAIGKDLAMDRSHAEFCGVSLLAPRVAAAYADLSSALEWRAQTHLYYEDLYAPLLRSVYALWIDVGADEYAEVDEPSDLDRAAEVIQRQRGAWQPPVSSESG
jgi:choline kinase